MVQIHLFGDLERRCTHQPPLPLPPQERAWSKNQDKAREAVEKRVNHYGIPPYERQCVCCFVFMHVKMVEVKVFFTIF